MKDSERCTQCGETWLYGGFHYWQRARVCRRCHEELTALLAYQLAEAAAVDVRRRWKIGKAWARRHCPRRVNVAEVAMVAAWVLLVAGVSVWVALV